MLTLLQQVKLFNNASIIVGDEGAAFVNLIWCNSSAKVACIIPEEWRDYNYSTIAYNAHVECSYIKADITEGFYHKLNPEVLIDFFKSLGITGGCND